MPLDPRAKRLLDMLALAGPNGTMDAAGRRQGFAALMTLSRVTAFDGAITAHDIPGPAGAIPLRLYAPAPARTNSPGLMFFHGGGLVAGDLDTHEGVCRMLAEASGARVVSVAYRLAPEHPFPAAIEDAIAAVRAIAAKPSQFGLDPTRLAVGGDSAGGTLAVLAATAARDAGHPPLRFQLLLCPVLDLAERRPSRLAFGQGYMLDQAIMDSDLAHYLPKGVLPSDPRVSPIHAADLAGLPPTLIHTAEYDPLRDEGHDYAARLAQAGVPVRHTCHPGMIHHFVGLTGVMPRARAALQAIGAEAKAAFATSL